MDLTPGNINRVTEILKKRFPNLTVQETIDLACRIILELKIPIVPIIKYDEREQ
jgi:hypothetical protein